jgi:hypothetical protein
LLIDDLLQGLWQIDHRELKMALCGDFLSDPRVQHVVAATKGDSTRTDHRNHFLQLHAQKELLPKEIIQFSDHHWCVNRVRHRLLDIRYFTEPLVFEDEAFTAAALGCSSYALPA